MPLLRVCVGEVGAGMPLLRVVGVGAGMRVGARMPLLRGMRVGAGMPLLQIQNHR